MNTTHGWKQNQPMAPSMASICADKVSAHLAPFKRFSSRSWRAAARSSAIWARNSSSTARRKPFIIALMGLRQSRQALGQRPLSVFRRIVFCHDGNPFSPVCGPLFLSPSYSMNCGQITALSQAYQTVQNARAAKPYRHFYRPILAIDKSSQAPHAGSSDPAQAPQAQRADYLAFVHVPPRHQGAPQIAATH